MCAAVGDLSAGDPASRRPLRPALTNGWAARASARATIARMSAALLLIGVLLFGAAWIGIVVAGLRRSVPWGLTCIFVPGGSVVFAVPITDGHGWARGNACRC